MRKPVIATLILLFAQTSFAIDPPREKEKWHRARVATFEIYSNADESATKRVAENVQLLRGAISKLTSLNVRSPLTTKIYLFRTEASFAPYRKATVGRDSRVTGIFVGHRDGNYVLINGDEGFDPERAIFHELTHYYINNTAPDVPLWFHEGLGEFYSTFEARGREVRVGIPNANHVQWLRGHSMIPLADLFAITAKSPEYNEGTRGGVYYAQAWAFMHYMLIGNEERRTQLRDFMTLLGEQKPVDEAFRSAFKTDYKTVEEELKLYVRRLAFPSITVRFTDAEAIEPARIEPIGRDEILFQLGDFLAHSGSENYEDARGFLLEAIRVNPKHAEAHASLGYVSERSDVLKSAGDYYEKAIQLDATDARTALRYAEYLLRKLDASYRAGGAQPADIAKTRELFRAAIRSNPELPRAWSGFGTTFIMSEKDDPAEGIAALEKSWSLAPSQLDVAFNLVVLYAKKGDTAKANTMIDRVLTRLADDDTVRRAREAVLNADLDKAEALIDAGKRPEAIALIERVIASTTNEALRKRLRDHVAKMRETEAHNQMVAQYNAAVAKANAQDLKGAIAILDELIAAGGDSTILEKATAMRERLKSKRR